MGTEAPQVSSPTATDNGASSAPTAADSGAKQGGDATHDASTATPTPKTYSESELSYLIVKRTEKLHERLASLEAELAKARPKEKTTEEKLYERFMAEHGPKLEAEQKARRAAEERAEQVELKEFVLANVGSVYNRDLALSLYGLPYSPPERLAKRDGKIVVVDQDNTVMPHLDPAAWVKAKMESKDFDFMRPGKGGGAGPAPVISQSAPSSAPTEAQPAIRHIGDAKMLARQMLREKQRELESK